MLIDSHCHLADAAFEADRALVIDRARAAGVSGVVVVAEDLASSKSARELCAGRDDLWPTAGIHPHRASTFDPGSREAIGALLKEEDVVAVGETGLDYHYDHSPRDVQRESFAWHLAASAETKKAAIVHAREADADVARLIADAPAGTTGVLHCFASGEELLEAGLARGFCVSFSGMITFKSWDAQWAVERVPDELLLVETDAPFLAPVPNRGKRNEPAFVTRTALRLAELRGTSPEKIAELTSANARRLFHLAPTLREP
ncbi:MAG: TatD family hydrolase [Gemmatimonadales bacterium]